MSSTGSQVAGVVGAGQPVLAEVAVEQLAHRLAEPGRDVDAVGDVGDRHVVDRAVGPQRVPHLARDLAVAARDAVGGAAVRSANCVTPNGSSASAGFVRPRAMSSSTSTPSVRRRSRASSVGDLLGRVGVVARRDRRVGGEDGARAGRRRARRATRARCALPRRARARAQANAAWPSLRWTTPGSMPHRLAAPARRRCRAARTGRGGCPASPTYRRDVIQRSAGVFSGRSASSRSSGTRPTSTRQIWATTSPVADGHA